MYVKRGRTKTPVLESKSFTLAFKHRLTNLFSRRINMYNFIENRTNVRREFPQLYRNDNKIYVTQVGLQPTFSMNEGYVREKRFSFFSRKKK